MRYEKLLEVMEPILAHPTTITSLHSCAHDCHNKGDLSTARKLEQLIKIFHNSSIPATVRIGTGTTFAYGGIATIVHGDCIIGKNCSIGSNVTIGGGQSVHPITGLSVPTIEDNVYVATGAKVFGGVILGKFSIIGANAVVTSDVPPFTIVAGNPSRTVKTIDQTNFKKYKGFIGRNIRFDESIFK